MTILLIGVGFSFVPFFGSLGPGEKENAALPRIDISSIQPGSFEFRPHLAIGRLHSGYDWHVLIYRKVDGSVNVWDVPMMDGMVGMPDLEWWRPFHKCQSFGPTVINGVVDESLPIMCHDVSLPSDGWSEQWRWDIDGNKLGTYVVNMYKTNGISEHGYFVFRKKS